MSWDVKQCLFHNPHPRAIASGNFFFVLISVVLVRDGDQISLYCVLD